MTFSGLARGGLATLAVALLVVLAAAPLRAEEPALVRVDIDDARVVDVLAAYAEVIGLNFVIADSAVAEQRITIVAPTPVSPDEARVLLLAALRVNGLQVEWSGDFVKVTAGGTP